MSHELRTPLNAIIGFGQLLELEELEPRLQEDVDHILRGGRHLLSLINEVLDIARVESGGMTLSIESTQIVDLVKETLALVTPLARQRDISLNIQPPASVEALVVKADQNRLRQVLLNVLSNAIKYNRAGGRVDVSFELGDDGRVRTAVADTGVGIPLHEMAKLFEPFERLGAERTEVDGTGLGLTLSKGLMEAMGGTIEVVSEPDSGTTFVLGLEPGEQYGLPAGELDSPETLGSLPPKAGDRWRILYVEDNLSNLTLVERILARHGNVEVLSAMQGRLGLELVSQHHFDLVILDLHLPDMPGTSVLSGLKAIDPALPVVVLTADATRTQAAETERLGAAAYLTKPLDIASFYSTITEALDGPRRSDEGGGG
jgi:CheY-like chemotaxis protein